MNDDELIVKNYLQSIGDYRVEYEPDGNQTPDFVINENIACEARRLNQFHINGNIVEPLETLEYSLYHKLKKIFKKFEDPSLPNSSFIGYTVRRPFKLNKVVVKEIEAACEEQMKHISTTRTYTIRDNLVLTFIPSEDKEDQLFLYGSTSDYNKGGFIVSEIIKSLNVIIQEKESKVKPFIERYPEWWLILVNHICMDIDRVENDQIRQEIMKSNVFSQIHIVSRVETGKGYIIQKN